MGLGSLVHLRVNDDTPNLPTLDPLSSAQYRRAKVLA